MTDVGDLRRRRDELDAEIREKEECIVRCGCCAYEVRTFRGSGICKSCGAHTTIDGNAVTTVCSIASLAKHDPAKLIDALRTDENARMLEQIRIGKMSREGRDE